MAVIMMKKSGNNRRTTNMKKTLKTICLWTSLLVAGLSLAACSADSDYPQPRTFTMTISAQKGDEATRGVLTDEGGSTITAEWSAGDVVAAVVNITKYSQLSGTLTAQTAGTSTILSGSITGEVEDDDQIVLIYGNTTFNNSTYSSQLGTLQDIAENYDMAQAIVTVSVDGDHITSSSDAVFQSLQAIVKFTLKNSTGTSELSATQVTVATKNEYNDPINITVTPASATSTLYVALPVLAPIENKPVTIIATVGGNKYECVKSSATFVGGDYYRVSAKLSELKALSAVTAEDLGKVIGSDGVIYSSVSSAVASGAAASGIIAYVGSAGSVDASSASYKGLAISVTDAPNEDNNHWFTSDSGTCSDQNSTPATAITYMNGIQRTTELTNGHSSHTHAAASAARNFATGRPDGVSAWFLPSTGQWNLIVQGLATKKAGTPVSTDLSGSENNTYKYGNLNSVITDAGGTGFSTNTTSAIYWSCNEWNTQQAWVMSFYRGYIGSRLKSKYAYVRPVFAF